MIRRPAAILALLTLLNGLNYLDRSVLSAVLLRIQQQLVLSNAQAGALATIFLVGYFTTCPLFSALEQRYSRTKLIALGIAIWSLATIACSFANSFAELAAMRALVGVGEASFVTLAPPIIDDIAPTAKRGLWLSIFYIAMPVGAALGYIVGGGVEHAHGYRAAFQVAGTPGLLLALTLLLVHDPDKTGAAERPAVMAQLREVVSHRVFRNAVLGYAAYTFALGAFSFWAPKYVAAEFNLPLDVANYKFGMITVVTGIFATLLGGLWSDRAAKRALRSDASEADRDRTIVGLNLRICVASALLGAPLAAACFLSTSATMFFVFVALCEFAVFLLSSPIVVVSMRAVPSPLRASGMAISVFAIHLFGDLWSPWIVGALADRSGSMSRAMMVLPVALGVAALIWARENKNSAVRT